MSVSQRCFHARWKMAKMAAKWIPCPGLPWEERGEDANWLIRQSIGFLACWLLSSFFIFEGWLHRQPIWNSESTSWNWGILYLGLMWLGGTSRKNHEVWSQLYSNLSWQMANFFFSIASQVASCAKTKTHRHSSAKATLVQERLWSGFTRDCFVIAMANGPLALTKATAALLIKMGFPLVMSLDFTMTKMV